MEIKHEADEYEARLADVISVVRDTIRRRWLVLLAVSGTILILGVLLVSQLTPIYSATAKVRLEPNRNPLATNPQQTRVDLSDEAIETELTSVRSIEVARHIVKAQGLVTDPEFAGALNKAGSPLASTDARETAVANALLQRLTVARETQTFVMGISFRSEDPIKAARLANAFAEGYIEVRTNKRLETARQQGDWFQRRLDELGRDASLAEGKAAEFRRRTGILESDSGGTITDQQVAPLAGSLAAAQSDDAAAQASLAAARAQMARGGLESISEVLKSQVITDLRHQRATAIIARNDVEARYGERHPESIRVRGQVAALDVQIQSEARRVMGSLEAAAASSKARVQSLNQSLHGLERERERSVVAGSAAYTLDREAAAKRALYDKLSQLSLDSTQASSQQISQAEVIPATPPGKPSQPNKPLLYMLALLGGLAVGAGVITVQEVMSGGFRSVEELEAQFGIPVLAVVPKVAKGELPSDVMLERPTSMFAEAYRIARTAILGGRAEAGVKVIALTSSLPAEGKTTSAVAFARTLAIAGSRVLLLECDVRRAAVPQMVKTPPPEAGIVELLHGEISLEQAIRPGNVPNLEQILVASPYFSAENLFGEGRMEKLLETLRDRYDYIVLDLPPLMGLADGRYLAILADATVVVVKWKSTPVAAVAASLNWLRADGARPIGTIFTQVDPSSHNVGGLYYYSSQYAGYYQGK